MSRSGGQLFVVCNLIVVQQVNEQSLAILLRLSVLINQFVLYVHPLFTFANSESQDSHLWLKNLLLLRPETMGQFVSIFKKV